MFRTALLGMVLASLAFLVGEAQATEPGHCAGAITVGGAGGASLVPHVAGEGTVEVGGALVCRLTKRIELLVELSGGPLFQEVGVVHSGALSLTAALLFEPIHWFRVGGALTPSLIIMNDGVAGALLAGPAAQFSLVPGRLDLMFQVGPKWHFPEHELGIEATVHFEVVLGKHTTPHKSH